MRRASPLFVLALLVLACDPDAPPPDGGARRDVGSEPCEGDSDCDDGVFCNGAERCLPENGAADARGCVVPDRSPCLAGQTCGETRRACVTDCAVTLDADGDGANAAECGGDDCDDADARRYPGATEVCDVANLDEDCDPTTFGVRDADGDGFPDASCCNGATCGTDCDDTRASVRPGGAELCNDIDDDCDGLVDEEAGIRCWADADRDGYAASGAATSMACGTCPSGTTARAPEDGAIDCADDDPGVRPDQRDDDCDGADGDCDGAVDEDATMAAWRLFYADEDGDGFGRIGDTGMLICAAAVPGRALAPGDCADDQPTVYPGAPDLCDRLTNDCLAWGSGVGLASLGEDRDGDLHAPLDATCRGGYPRDDCADLDAARLWCDPIAHPVASQGGRVRIGDVDRDGRLDVVRRGADLAVHYADAGGGFTAGSITSGGPAGTARGLQLADIDGDGDLDVVVDGELSVWRSPGARGGTWAQQLVAASGTVATFGAGAPVADYDGDGDLDVVAARDGTSLQLWAQGPAGWTNRVLRTDSGTGRATHAIHPYDLDRDGRMDVVYATTQASDYGVRWLQNPGPVTGSWPRQIVCGDSSNSVFQPRDFAMADGDGDGSVDVIAPVPSGGAVRFDFCRGPGAPPPPAWARENDGRTVATSLEEIEVIDLDGDADLDTLEHTTTGIVWHERRGTAWVRHVLYTPPLSFTSVYLATADMDGDGDLDVVVGTDRVVVWLEMSGGPFSAPRL